MPRRRSKPEPTVRVFLPPVDPAGLRALLDEWADAAVAGAWAAATGNPAKLTAKQDRETIPLEVEKRPPGDLVNLRGTLTET